MKVNKIRTYYLNTRFLITRTRKAVSSFKVEVTKTTGTTKGDIFEDFVRKYLFPKKTFQLLHRTPHYTNKDFNESLLFPDFIFQDRHNQRIRIAVEAKYLSTNNNKTVNVCRKEQLERYKKFQQDHDIKVFIALGLKASPYLPEEIFLIPIERMNVHYMYPNLLHEFGIARKEAITRTTLENLLNPYASNVMKPNPKAKAHIYNS